MFVVFHYLNDYSKNNILEIETIILYQRNAGGLGRRRLKTRYNEFVCIKMLATNMIRKRKVKQQLNWFLHIKEDKT